MTRDDDHRFAARIAGISAAGYSLTVTIATYFDARLPSRVLFGARTYTYGYVTALLALPIFFSTLMMLKRGSTRGWKCLASCVPLLAAVLGSMWVFAPQIPHAGIITWSAMYGIVVLIATWIRYSEPNLAFVHVHSTPMAARLEGLKSTLSIWQTIALATCAGFLAGIVPWANSALASSSSIVRTREDIVLLNAAVGLQVAIVSFAILCGPIREVVQRVLSIAAEFGAIKD